MSSTFRLTSSVAYPAGMVVRAYPRGMVAAMDGDPPVGTPVSAAVMQEDGSAQFAGLEPGMPYVAAARVEGRWTYVNFRTLDAVPVSQQGPTGGTGPAGAPFALAWAV